MTIKIASQYHPLEKMLQQIEQILRENKAEITGFSEIAIAHNGRIYRIMDTESKETSNCLPRFLDSEKIMVKQ